LKRPLCFASRGERAADGKSPVHHVFFGGKRTALLVEKMRRLFSHPAVEKRSRPRVRLPISTEEEKKGTYRSGILAICIKIADSFGSGASSRSGEKGVVRAEFSAKGAAGRRKQSAPTKKNSLARPNVEGRQKVNAGNLKRERISIRKRKAIRGNTPGSGKKLSHRGEETPIHLAKKVKKGGNCRGTCFARSRFQIILGACR